jgi:hypothetical protein
MFVDKKEFLIITANLREKKKTCIDSASKVLQYKINVDAKVVTKVKCLTNAKVLSNVHGHGCNKLILNLFQKYSLMLE